MFLDCSASCEAHWAMDGASGSLVLGDGYLGGTGMRPSGLTEERWLVVRLTQEFHGLCDRFGSDGLVPLVLIQKDSGFLTATQSTDEQWVDGPRNRRHRTPLSGGLEVWQDILSLSINPVFQQCLN